MNDTATRQGAAPSEPQTDPDVNPEEEVEVRPNPRDAALEAMGRRQEELRQQELQEALDSDPGLAHQQQAIEREIQQANAEAGIVHETEQQPPADADGAASREAMHEPEPAQPDLPSNLQDDPMADFIEMHNGQPMVKAKVNGQDRLIPLADAKRQVQIGISAELRMQNAAEVERNLNEREQRLSAGEAALQARMQSDQPQPTAPAARQQQPDLSDEDLEREATEIFETAFSGTEEDAAKKLAKTLVKIRDSAAVRPTQQIDAGQIARQAASLAVGTLSAQDRQKDVSKGFAEFQKSYPEIIEDPNLFKMADDMTETIERENPDWSIAQVMDEAGKRTRAWVKGLSGEKDTGDDPTPPPDDGQNSHVSDSTTQTRQERKAGLVRMPSPAAAATFSEPEETGEQEQSPQEAFLELKKARGQPV